MDRALALRLAEAEVPVPAPSLDDVVDALPTYDEAEMPDPFAKLPPGVVT